MEIKMNRLKTPVQKLTLITTLTTLLISIYSLINNNIYTERINQISQFELMGQDIVTGLISIIFIFIIILSDFNEIKIKTVWLGCLMYIFYIYAYFSFGGVTSPFYLIYISLTGLSLFIFFFILFDIIKTSKYPATKEKYPRKSISFFLVLCVLLVGAIEIRELIIKTITQPEKINPFFVFYVLDLGLIFPLIFISAIIK